MNASLKGLLSENAAVSELIARNFNVAKPVVDIYGYDFIVCKNDKYNKVQVRSYHTISQNCYKFHCNHGSYANIPYKKDMVDFFIFSNFLGFTFLQYISINIINNLIFFMSML